MSLNELPDVRIDAALAEKHAEVKYHRIGIRMDRTVTHDLGGACPVESVSTR